MQYGSHLAILQSMPSLSITNSAIIPPVSTEKHKYLLPPSLLSNLIATCFTLYSLVPRQNFTGLTCPPSNSATTFIILFIPNKIRMSIASEARYMGERCAKATAKRLPYSQRGFLLNNPSNNHMEIPRWWRNQRSRYRLLGEKCPEGHFIFPPRQEAPCPECAAAGQLMFVFLLALDQQPGVLSAVDERSN